MTSNEFQALEAKCTTQTSRKLYNEIVRLRSEIADMNRELQAVEEQAARLLRSRNAMAVRCAQLQLELTDLRNETHALAMAQG